jgi:hypothetical protein
MSKEEIVIPEIPHGHGLSFKKGIADGLLDKNQYESEFHKTHSANYRMGKELGVELKALVAKYVKD